MKTTNAEYRRGAARGRQLRGEPGAEEDACLVGMRELAWWLGAMARDACGGSRVCERGYRDSAGRVALAIKRARWCRRWRRAR